MCLCFLTGRLIKLASKCCYLSFGCFSSVGKRSAIGLGALPELLLVKW
jgi:hypothetical protein